MGCYVGIEAGGTKFICAAGSNIHTLSPRHRIQTHTPKQTMPEVIQYIRNIAQTETIDGIGIACFGPLELDENAHNYGAITSTPKVAWQHYNIVQALQSEFNVPIGFDTDVNATALAEQRWGAAQDCHSIIYITVGTGIGVGVIINNQLVHGAMHPESGHICIPQLAVDNFAGVCPFHGNCLEGLASGPALKERWQVNSALDLPDDHQAWDWEAEYLAEAIYNYTLCYAPMRVIMGGGVMRHHGLIEKIRPLFTARMNGYVTHNYLDSVDQYIVLAGLAENAGVAGALALAEQAHEKAHQH